MNALRLPLSRIRRRSGMAAAVLVAAALLAGSIATPADAATHKQRTRVSMSLSATAVASGEVVTVSGKLSATHAKLKGAKVSVQFIPAGGKRWHTMWVGTVNRAGQVSHAFPIKSSVSVQIKFAGSRTLKPSVSTSKFISVPEGIAVTSVLPATLDVGQTVTFSGTATPSLVGRVVRLKRTGGARVAPGAPVSGGAEVLVTTGLVAPDGTFVLTDKPPVAGRYSYRAQINGRSTGWRQVTVYSGLPTTITINSTSSASLTLPGPITISGVAGLGLAGSRLALVRTGVELGSVAQTVANLIVPADGSFSFVYTPTELGAAHYQVVSFDPASASEVMTFTVS